MKKIQRLESAAILTLLLFTYKLAGSSWIVFIVFLFLPDISIISYVKGPKTGAIVYNICHSYFIPVALFFLSMLLNSSFGVTLAFIWAAHIAFDRMLGFGLKLPTGFKDTHLGKLK